MFLEQMTGSLLGSDVQVLKDLFQQTLKKKSFRVLSAGSRDEATEKRLATELSSEPVDPICRYVMQRGEREES